MSLPVTVVYLLQVVTTITNITIEQCTENWFSISTSNVKLGLNRMSIENHFHKFKSSQFESEIIRPVENFHEIMKAFHARLENSGLVLQN